MDPQASNAIVPGSHLWFFIQLLQNHLSNVVTISVFILQVVSGNIFEISTNQNSVYIWSRHSWWISDRLQRLQLSKLPSNKQSLSILVLKKILNDLFGVKINRICIINKNLLNYKYRRKSALYCYNFKTKKSRLYNKNSIQPRTNPVKFGLILPMVFY